MTLVSKVSHYHLTAEMWEGLENMLHDAVQVFIGKIGWLKWGWGVNNVDRPIGLDCMNEDWRAGLPQAQIQQSPPDGAR